MSHTVSSATYYVKSDGTETQSRSDGAEGIPEDTLIQYWKSVSNIIPAGYALGVAARESGKLDDGTYVTNERDEDTQDDGSTKTTYGIFQMNKAEAALAAVFFSQSSMLDPQNNCLIAAVTFNSHLDDIISAAQDYDENWTDNGVDKWAYLAWAHNAGVGEPVTSIKKYGLDWEATKTRNQQENNAYMVKKMIPYAEYVLGEVRRIPDIGNGEDNHHALTVGSLLVFVGIGALLLLERLA